MKEIGKLVMRMEKAPYSYPMEPSSKENTRMGSLMDKAHSNRQTENYMTGNGKMVSQMEKAPRSGPMEPSIKENGKMVR